MILISSRTERALAPLARHGLPYYRGDVESALRSGIVRAARSKASRNCLGNVLPRFSARWSIPAHAVELKKNREGIGPVSRTRDNEQTTAALGNSEILGIKDTPRDCSLGSKHTTSA